MQFREKLVSDLKPSKPIEIDHPQNPNTQTILTTYTPNSSNKPSRFEKAVMKTIIDEEPT